MTVTVGFDATTVAAMTQNERVERMLRLVGAHGVTAVDFMLPDVIDGGAPITRFAARIHELRTEHGVAIIKNGRRQKCDVYMLDTAWNRQAR